MTERTFLFLTEQEIAELTGKQKAYAQAKVLNGMGINHKIRPDGSIAILRAHVASSFGASDLVMKKKSKTPDWDAINNRFGNVAQA